MKHFLRLTTIFTLLLFFGGSVWGQTVTSYDFSDPGAVTGLNEPSPGITLDANIGFGSFKNSGTSNPVINSGQLRLYQNATKGGSIKVYASNGVIITQVIVHASSATGAAAFTVDGGPATNLSGGTTYTMSSLSATSVVEFYVKDGITRIYVDDFEVTYTAGGNQPPSISNIIQTPATNISSTTTVSVSADVTDASKSVSSVELKWGTSTGSYTGGTITMANGGSGDTYTTLTDIPEQVDGTTVYYIIEATDNELATATSDEQSYNVIDPLTIPFTDDFTIGKYEVTLGGEGSDGASDYFFKTDGSNISPSYTGATGNFFAGQDIDDGGWVGSASPSQLTWTNIDVSGVSNLIFSSDFASVGGGIDDADYLLFEYRIDDGSWTNLIAFENKGGTNTNFWEDTDFDGTGDGTQLTGTFSNFTKDINNSGSSIDLRITVGLDSGGEEFAIDNVSLSEKTVAPEPTNHASTFIAGPGTDGSDEIDLLWDDNDGTQPADGFLIVGRTSTGSFYTPIDGTDPSNDSDWSDGDFEVKVGHGEESYSVSGLEPSTQYFFKIYPYTNSGSDIDFKTDGTVPDASATTNPEPPGSLTLTVNGSDEINVAWTKNGNGDDILVVYDLDGSFTDPVNGNTYSVSSSALGGTVIYNGSGTFYDHSGLSAETIYSYKIWSVNGSAEYSSGITANATTAKIGPTNQPTDFATGILTTTTLPLTWTAAVAGSQSPDGYLLLLTTGTITDPEDGTDPGAGSLTISSGAASFKTTGTGETFTSADAGTMYNMKIYSYTNSGSLIDFNLTSPPSLSVATLPNPVTGASVSATGATTANISWSAASGYNSTNHSTLVFVKQGSAVTASTPTNAPSTYTANTAFGSGTAYQNDAAAYCVYNGDGTAVSITALAANTTYYVLIYTVLDANNSDATHSYSSAESANGTTLLSEPSNHPSDISATANSTTQITVEWTDATTGEQLPEAYLVKAAEHPATPTAPIDGTPESDGTLVKNIIQGTQQAIFTGLNPSTTYNFSIWPYTNSGTDVDYKLVDHQTTSATTLTPLGTPLATAASDVGTTGFTANWNAAASATSYRLDVSEYETFATAGSNMTDLIISEYVEGSSSNKYIEIFNGTGSSVDLSDYKLQLYANGGSSTTNDITLSGTLLNNSVIVYKNSSAALTLPDGVTAIDNAAVNFNGDDAVALYKISTSSYVDIFGRIGNDPGSAWTGDGGYTTVDKTLVRKSTVTSGITTSPSGTGPTAFTTLTTEWDLYDIDAASNLGSHTFSGGSSPSYTTGYEDLTVNGTSQVVSGLTPNTTYYYRVRATDGVETSVNSNVVSALTDAAATTTYTGTGTWSDAANWSDGPPGSATNTTVTGTLTVDDIFECNNLTISTSGGVTVSSGQGLSVNGDFLIQSTGDGTGSFIGATADYDITGSITVQRYLTNYSTADDDMYHFISSPVALQPIQPGFVGNPPLATVDFYKFDEPTNYWINSKIEDPENPGNLIWYSEFESEFVVGRGYLASYPTAPIIKSFTGNLNSYPSETPLVLNCTYNESGGSGWNLLGNPFPSAIDWTLVALGDGMDDALYYYDAAAQNYRYYIQLAGETVAVGSGSQFIPAMQGFMVHAKSTGTKTVTIDDGDRAHNGQNIYYKSASSIPGSFSITVTANGFSDELFVHFNSNATSQFDGKYDAYKLSSYNTHVPKIYTLSSNGDKLAINGLPELTEEIEIPVFYIPGTEGLQMLTANLSGLEAALFITDLKTGITQNLYNNPEFQFTASADDDPNRFLLKFSSVGIEDEKNELETQFAIYSFQSTIYLSSHSGSNARIEIFNTTGQHVFAKNVILDSLTQINPELTTGWYVVKVTTSEGMATEKVFIR